MNINISEYEKFYDQLKPIFEAANQCIDANPCSELTEYIDEIVNGISNSLTELEWEDVVREQYNLALETGIENLELIKSSINATWTQSETLYRDILTTLEELNDKVIALSTKLNDEQNAHDSKYKKIELDGTININYSLYNSDHRTWKRECESLNSSCSSLKDNINQLLEQLKGLNSDTVEVNQIASLPGGKQVLNPKGYCIVIDAGHGGTDGGATYNGVKEKDLNLQYALALAEELRARGLDVTLTRTDDTTIDKTSRKALMNSPYQGNKNVIVISNHMNSTSNHSSNARGTEIYYPIDESRNGKALAECIINRIGEETSLSTSRGIKTKSSSKNSKTDYYFMLSGTGKRTSILLEYGFLDNPEDASILINEQDKNVRAVADGICDFVDNV